MTACVSPWRHGLDQRFGGPVHLPDPPERIRNVAEQKEIVSDDDPTCLGA